jgi:hypothetical protein
VRIGGGVGCGSDGSSAGKNSAGQDKFQELGFVFVNYMFSMVRDVKG